MKKYGAKKDANHKELMGVIKKFCAVYDLSSAGYGIPDGIAYVKNGWRLFDIKNPKTSYGRKGLNKRQQKWASDWRGGGVFIIRTVDEAVKFANGSFEGLECFEAGSAGEAIDFAARMAVETAA